MSYGGDFRRGEVMNISNWVLTGFAIALVTIRVISRSVLTSNFGHDDALMVFSLLVLVAYNGVLSGAISHGYGKHTWTVEPEEASIAVHLSIITCCICVTAFAWPKLAVVALLERTLGLKARTRVILWLLVIVLCVWSLIVSALWYAQCTPRAHQWDPINVPGTCFPASVIVNQAYSNAVYSGALDVILALFPPCVIAKLSMPVHQKVVFCVALGGGLLGAVCAFYKITRFPELGQEAKKDPMWADGPLLIWTTIEVVMLIVGGSLPTIGPFVRYVAGRSQEVYDKYTTRNSVVPPQVVTIEPPKHRANFLLGLSYYSIRRGLSTLNSQDQDDIGLVEQGQKKGVQAESHEIPPDPINGT